MPSPTPALDYPFTSYVLLVVWSGRWHAWLLGLLICLLAGCGLGKGCLLVFSAKRSLGWWDSRDCGWFTRCAVAVNLVYVIDYSEMCEFQSPFKLGCLEQSTSFLASHQREIIPLVRESMCEGGAYSVRLIEGTANTSTRNVEICES